MRKVFYSLNISIDACYDHTQFTPDESMMEYFTGLLRDADLLVYGRKIYDLMFPYWSDVARDQSRTTDENEFAQTISAIDKIVFSRSLNKVEGNTRIVRDNLVDEIRKLKQQPGKKISIAGASVLSLLMEAGLIDEYYFVLHPVLVAKGKRLLEGFDLAENLKLKLVDTQIFKSGSIGLHYQQQ